MKRLALIALCLLALGLAFNPGAASAAHGTMGKCLVGCLPGLNACTKCCDSAFGKVQGPCLASCKNTLQHCEQNCTSQLEMCLSADGVNCAIQYDQCRMGCQNAFSSCDTNCGGIETEFNCPNWVNPDHKCPYDCQSWNPTTRSCVGPPHSGCK